MNRVRPEVPSFFTLAKCLRSRPRVPIFKRGASACAGYRGCSFYVEKRGRVTPGGVKLLARGAKRGIIKVPDEKRAMLFLYGRDLFEYEVISPPCETGYALVYWDDVLLGLGKVRGKVVLNVLDFGEFLRRGF